MPTEFDLIHEDLRTDPEAVWDRLSLLLCTSATGASQDEEHLARVDLIEDLVYSHADAFIDRLEALAQACPQLRMDIASAYVGGVAVSPGLERFYALQQSLLDEFEVAGEVVTWRLGMRRPQGNVHPLEEQSRTAVDVASIADDSELDDRLWTRVSTLSGEASREEVLRMPEDVRAYFLTRAFEWLSDGDGPETFPMYYPGLLDLLPDAYRHLGLTGAAEAAARFVAAAPTQRVAADADAEISLAEREELLGLLGEVGSNDAARIAFVRKRAEAISDWTISR